MRALLLKDVVGQKPNVLLGATYSLLFFILFGIVGESFSSGVVYVISGVVVGLTILLGSFKLDANDTTRFVYSLPIARATAVNEKFALLLAGTLFGTVCATIFGAILSVPSIAWSTGLPTGIDMLRIVAGMGLLSFFIPLYFRVGHTIIRYVLIIGLGLLVAGQVAGMLVLNHRRGSGPIPFFDVVFGWMSGEGGDLRRTAMLAAAGLFVTVVSYVVSRIIWARRDI